MPCATAPCTCPSTTAWSKIVPQSSTIEFIPIKLSGAECEVHPEMMEGAAECPLRLQHSRKGEHEALPLVRSHDGESQERGRAGLQPVHGQPAIAGPPFLRGIVYDKSG